MDRRHSAEASSISMDHNHGSTDATGAEVPTMMSVFQTNMRTSLYSSGWTPSNAGTYAATCLFLIGLAVALRGLLALKSIQESRWLDAELKRRYVVVNGRLPMAEQLSRDSLAKQMVLSENGVEESVTVVQRKRTITQPWRMSVDPLRACVDVVIAGVGYLL
jgi:hypothetical protein